MASAYSVADYRIAAELGGDEAWASLRERAAARGIRLAADMVPNHMGIDSKWVVERPDLFVSSPYPPFEAYSFTGGDLSSDDRVVIQLEDHYWDSSDAAVVFKRIDKATGEERYIYHGNDGTSFPWNDTAQLDYVKAEVREAVIEQILEVARRFSVIRFDAAMVLARRHIQRLWYPQPGHEAGIPSRSAAAIPADELRRLMPQEFWREVVDRVAQEVPDTLLLAEAFWLMEGYFVRTLGMHRVYNSAFMHMLRDEKNAEYQQVIRETVSFDARILGRYVNFMNNPDERSAIDQFGSHDKYFGVATLLATLPGLPMFGHGQFEGYSEQYGMEFRRAQRDETARPGPARAAPSPDQPAAARALALLRCRRLPPADGARGRWRHVPDVFAYANDAGSGPRGAIGEALARRLPQPLPACARAHPGCGRGAGPGLRPRRLRHPLRPSHRARRTCARSATSARTGSSWSSTATAATCSWPSRRSRTPAAPAGPSWPIARAWPACPTPTWPCAGCVTSPCARRSGPSSDARGAGSIPARYRRRRSHARRSRCRTHRLGRRLRAGRVSDRYRRGYR